MPNERPSHHPFPEPGGGRLTAFQTTLLAGGVILFLVLLYEMRGFLNPPVVGLATVVLLWPLRMFRSTRALLFAALLLMLLWLMDQLATILFPFALMYLFAYLLDPLVTEIHRRYAVPRWISSMLATLLLVGLFVLIIFLLVPSLISQFEILFRRLTDAVGSARDWLQTTTLLDNLERVGVDKQQVITDLTSFLQEQATKLATSIPVAVQTLVSSIGTVLGAIAIITVLPVVHYYTLKDYPFIKQRLVELFPTFAGRRDYLVEAGGIVGNYLRGQLLISAIAAFNVSVALIILDMPFALLIGILGGLLNMVPNLGIVLTNVIGILIGLIFGDPWYFDVTKVVLVLLGQSFLEQAVLTPNIMSYQVGLHPVLIILSLFVFGYFMGWFGLLIAVPATALIMTGYKTYRDRFAFELTDPSDLSSIP